MTELVRVEHRDPAVDGPLTEEAMRDKLESVGYEVTRYVYPPGTYFPPHTHSVDKIDAVLFGRFRMSITGQHATLVSGDRLTVPRGVVHDAEVLGDAGCQPGRRACPMKKLRTPTQ